MALDNYTDLQAAIGNWLNRGDLSAAIPDFITLTEAQMLRKIARARNEGQMLPRDMLTGAEQNFAITGGVEYAAVPSGFLGVVSFDIQTATVNPCMVQLDYVSQENLVYLKQMRGITATPDTPGVYSIVGSQFQFLPVPDINYQATLFYWQTLTPLSQAPGGVNWVLQKHPDAYLYGALSQAAPYLMDDARLPVWQGLFNQAIDDLLTSDPLPNDRSWLRAESALTFRPNSTTTFNINTGDFTYGP